MNSMRATTLAGQPFGVRPPSHSAAKPENTSHRDLEAVGDYMRGNRAFLEAVESHLRALVRAGYQKPARQAEELNVRGVRTANGGRWTEDTVRLAWARIRTLRQADHVAKPAGPPPGISRTGVRGHAWIVLPGRSVSSLMARLGALADETSRRAGLEEWQGEARLRVAARDPLPDQLLAWAARERPFVDVTLLLGLASGGGPARMVLHPTQAELLRTAHVRSLEIYMERTDDPPGGFYRAFRHAFSHTVQGSGHEAMLDLQLRTDGGGWTEKVPTSVLTRFLQAGGRHVSLSWRHVDGG